MTSPIIDEDVMLQALKKEGGDDDAYAVQRIRTGAAMLLVDALDRKVTRDQFLAALGAAITLIDALGKREMMLNVKNFMARNGAVTHADVEVALHSVGKILEASVEQCTKMGELLQQCPMDEDRVH